ncbi:hypothetical protein OIB37_31165 [Streptomyces sp. NBC_00820]|uniref:hypothetical protein n=1 Tax=Streptomyces sp. NBC_00820 TaxID=2975842 RepID=UPI002ED0247A|nr:hypothetical protein OIB37_31165 [Streptomyces sp. NBC_00820]
MIRTILRGGVAGAAGTTVLNAVSYADMAWRGRSASGVPSQVVDKLARDVRHPVPGSGETRDNRLSALGALAGIGVGCVVGVCVCLLYDAGARMPWWWGSVATGALAMAAADVPMARLGLSDPTTWSGADWVSDIVPHLLYGAATYGIVAATAERRS